MRAALRIAQKDLRQRLRDRSAIVLGIIAPLGLAFIFSLIIPDAANDFSVELGVVDNDGGHLAEAFRTEVLGSLEGQGFVIPTTYATESELREAVESGTAEAGLVIPSGFTAAVTAPGPGTCDANGCTAATLEVIGHVDRQTSAQITEAVAESFAGELTTVRVAVAAASAQGRTDLAEVATAAAETPALVGLDDMAAASRTLDLNTFFAAGMAIFFLFFTVQFGVSSLIEERSNGTMPRLLAAPVRWWHIVAGKGLASFALGIVAMTVLIVGSTLLIDANWGDPLGVALLVVTAVLAAIGIMAVIATLARTAEQAGNWQAIVAVVLGMMGGTFFPISQGPAFLARLSSLTPHYWFMRGLGDMQGGGGAAEVVPAAGALLVFFVLAIAVAATRVKAMVRP
jgi:ABC-2 type transport system permease protein